MVRDSCSHMEIDYLGLVCRRYLNRVEATMTRESPLLRQWILLRSLSARRYGMTVKEMAAEIGAGEKTVRRYLETFQEAGFPLEEIDGEFGRKTWRLTTENGQPALSFTFDEAAALYLGRRLMEPLAGTLFWDATQRALKKVRSLLGEPALRYIDRFGAMFHQTTVGTSDYSKKADLIDELMIGIEDRRAVFITYQSLKATEPVTYDVYPLGLTYHRGSLYLIGCAPQHDAIRHWKVDRIEAAETTEVRFQRPEDFDLQEHLSKSFGIFQGDGDVRVKIRFSPTVARYVTESKWHPSQQLTREKDSSVLAEFQLDGTEEVMRWVLSFGRHAEVLEPKELASAICDEAEEVRRLYSSSPRRSSRHASSTSQE